MRKCIVELRPAEQRLARRRVKTSALHAKLPKDKVFKVADRCCTEVRTDSPIHRELLDRFLLFPSAGEITVLSCKDGAVAVPTLLFFFFFLQLYFKDGTHFWCHFQQLSWSCSGFSRDMLHIFPTVMCSNQGQRQSSYEKNSGGELQFFGAQRSGSNLLT